MWIVSEFQLIPAIPIRIRVDGEQCATKVYVPNAFSPNDDGINDEFQPFLNLNLALKNYSLQIYNRWGGLVFESRENNATWNGRIKNVLAPSGVYFWVLQYELDTENDTRKVERLSGEVMLIR